MNEEEVSERVRAVLFPDRPEGGFAPTARWEDLGALIEALEARGYFLLLNGTSDPELKRVAAFHVVSPDGFPCAGSSGWGPWPTVGHAVLLACDEALFRPRITG